VTLTIAVLVFSTAHASAIAAVCGVGTKADSAAKSKDGGPLEMTQFKSEKPPQGFSRVPVTEAQLQAIKSTLDATIRVVSKVSLLKAEESVFGVGRDHWPKKPGPVLLRFYEKEQNSMISGVAFQRVSETDDWSKGSFGLYPQFFPREVFDLRLQGSFFASMKFIAAREEERPNEQLEKVNVFYFEVIGTPVKTGVQFEAHPEASNLTNRFPQAFHKLTVSR
jgi:hypothetical protein